MTATETHTHGPGAPGRSGRLRVAAGALVAVMALATPGPDVTLAAQPRAHAARTVSLRDTGNLRLMSKHGFTLNERGTASGTVRGTIYVHLTIVATNRVTAEVSIYPSGGSITGEATASYHKGSASATFFGSLSIARGTGSFANARGSGLSFSGTIQKSNQAITVHVSGTVTD
jgi:hypothetical protein